MGLESHTRCRYYPNCMIHTGTRFTYDVGRAERKLIIDAYNRGVRPRAICKRHNLTQKQVNRIVNQPNTKITKP